MMAGDVLLAIALLSSMAAVPLYLSGNAAMARWGRGCAFLSGAAALGAGGLLLWMLLADRFDVAYVAGYSSRELPTVYKCSAFWAGQQGSFLLWLIVHGVAGGVLAHSFGKGRQEDFREIQRAAIGFHMGIFALLAILVLAKSPFAALEAPAENGAGLNPLLQDPWMAIHPPLVFLGYALLAVPLAYSLGTLLRDPASRYWLEPARRWCLVAWAFLGAGIFVGGYWAYKVLGWGGYWGWDPVENSSLVPWLLAAAALHLLRAAKVREAVLPMAHLSVIFCFSLALYGTFLTRSGLLGDFSVHSFSGAGIGAAIAAANALVLVGGLLLLALRAGKMPMGDMYGGFASREFLLLLGMLLMAFIASLVFLGMSTPLLAQMAERPAAVDASFYVRSAMPLAVGMMLAMAAACLRPYGTGHPLPGRALSLGGFLAGLAIPLAFGIREFLPLLLSGVSLLAAAASFQSWKRGALGLGGFVAHAGVGISLAAMVLSGNGSLSATREFSAGEGQEILGHEVVYHGQEFAEDGRSKRYVYSVDGREAAALTKLRANGADAAREPAIARSLSGDVYIAPSPAGNGGMEEKLLRLRELSVGDGIAYIFEAIEIASDGEHPSHQRVDAQISVTDGKVAETVRASILVTADGGTSRPVPVLGGKRRIRLTGVSGDRRLIRLELLPSAEEAARAPVTATVSTKPCIWALWLGCALVTAGILIAAARRGRHG